MRLTSEAHAALTSFGRPWVLGGDFNMPPTRVLHELHALSLLGMVCYPPMSTYVSGITHTVIDYVVCHPYITSLVGSVEALRHTDLAPRLPACLMLSTFVPDTPVTVLRTPPRQSLLPLCGPQTGFTAVDARLVEASAAFSEALTT
jgi:hypothetical protein